MQISAKVLSPPHIEGLLRGYGIGQATVYTMQQKAMAYGKDIIATVQQLEELFASQQADIQKVIRTIVRVATLKGELHMVRLQASIDLNGEMSKHQRIEYERFCGYTPGHPYMKHH